MEHTLKKKTKQLIALRTNNFIQTQIEKQTFFNQVIDALQKGLDPKQFQFLTTYLLFQQNPMCKRIKQQLKNSTQKRILTQPEERAFNICEIDPNLFQQNSSKKDNFIQKKTSIRTKQTDCNCINTPRKRTRHIVFQNKRIMDLDRRLKAKYQAQKNFIVYNPKILNMQKENKKNDFFLIKTAYQKTVKKTNTKSEIRRLKTSFAYSRQQRKITKERPGGISKDMMNSSRRNTQMRQISSSLKFRQSQNSIPKYLLQQVLLSRRYIKLDNSSNDFSDFKLSSRYKDCFS